MKKHIIILILLINNILLAQQYASTLVRFSDSTGLYGFKHKQTGKTIVKPKYSDYDYSPNYLILVHSANGLFMGAIDTNGKEVVPLKYESVDYFWEGLAPVKLKGKSGFVNMKGEEIIPLIYDNNWGHFCNGVAWMVLKNKMALFDRQGNQVTKFIYENPDGDFCRQGTASVKLNNKWIEINRFGQQIPDFQDLYKESYFLSTFLCNNKFGLIHNHHYLILAPCIYDSITQSNYNETLFNIKLNGKWGLMDERGNIVMKPSRRKKENKKSIKIQRKYAIKKTSYTRLNKFESLP